jgi:hypothetical protein
LTDVDSVVAVELTLAIAVQHEAAAHVRRFETPSGPGSRAVILDMSRALIRYATSDGVRPNLGESAVWLG